MQAALRKSMKAKVEGLNTRSMSGRQQERGRKRETMFIASQMSCRKCDAPCMCRSVRTGTGAAGTVRGIVRGGVTMLITCQMTSQKCDAPRMCAGA